jgi:hypothetical protein
MTTEEIIIKRDALEKEINDKLFEFARELEGSGCVMKSANSNIVTETLGFGKMVMLIGIGFRIKIELQ